MVKKLALIILIGVIVLVAKSHSSLDISAVPGYVGETVTVCGTVDAVKSLPSSFLISFTAKSDKRTATVVIADADLDKFSDLKKTDVNQEVCITGKVILTKDQPQIVLKDAKQIRFK